MTQNPCYALVPSSVKHPATYTESFIPKFAELLFGCANVLDPFGGAGKLALIKEHGFTGKVVCNELQTTERNYVWEAVLAIYAPLS